MRGCRNPGCPNRTRLECPRGDVASQPAFGNSWSQVSLPDVGSDSDHKNVEAAASGVAFHRALVSAEGQGTFSDSVLRCSGLQCPVMSHKVLRSPALCSGGKTGKNSTCQLRTFEDRGLWCDILGSRGRGRGRRLVRTALLSLVQHLGRTAILLALMLSMAPCCSEM